MLLVGLLGGLIAFAAQKPKYWATAYLQIPPQQGDYVGPRPKIFSSDERRALLHGYFAEMRRQARPLSLNFQVALIGGLISVSCADETPLAARQHADDVAEDCVARFGYPIALALRAETPRSPQRRPAITVTGAVAASAAAAATIALRRRRWIARVARAPTAAGQRL